VFAFGFAAVQLLPTIELLGYSSRENWDYATLLSSAQHPALLARAIWPERFGSPLDGSLAMSHLARGNGYFIQSYVSSANYAGIAPLLLAVVGIATWRARARRWAAGLAAVALLLAFGTPLLHAYRALPGLDVSRVDRVIVLYFFALAALAAGGLDTLLRAASARRARGAWAACVIAGAALAALVVDLYPYGARYNVSHPRAALPDASDPLVQRLSGGLDRIARVGDPGSAILPGNVTAPLGIPDLHGMNDLPLARWQELVEAMEPGIYARRRIGPIRSEATPLSPVLDLLNVRYLLALAPRGERAGVKVIERPTALPRAFVVPRVEVVPGAAERLARLADRGFDPRATALVESGVPSWTEGMGEATVTRYEPERVEIVVDGSGGGLLLADNWYPGWTARIDGAPAPVLRANHALRLVPLPPGRHVVTFAFRPRSLASGFAITAATCVAALVVVVVRRRAERPGARLAPGAMPRLS
jgi:hypothetical protein